MDLISFEDLVVQPYNSYFNLEKELLDVKAKLSLMEQRLKYLEKPAKKPAKKYKKKPAKKDTDVEDYELIAKKIQNDADRKLRLINRNGLRKKNEEEMIKRKEEWEKWDKEREDEEFKKYMENRLKQLEENERRKKFEEELEKKRIENKKYYDSIRKYWIPTEEERLKKMKEETNSNTDMTNYFKKLENKKNVEEYLKMNVDDTYLKTYWEKTIGKI
jgi:hypothetical protein